MSDKYKVEYVEWARYVNMMHTLHVVGYIFKKYDSW